MFGQKETLSEEKTDSETKLSYQAQKEQQAKERKLKNQIKKIENEIEETEEKIQQLDEKLSQPEIATNADKAREIFDEKTALETHLNELYEQWEAVQV